MPSFDFSNVESQLAAARKSSEAVSDSLAVVAGGVSAPGGSWNESGALAAYSGQVVKTLSSTTTAYLDAEWAEYRWDDAKASFNLVSPPGNVVWKDGRWTAPTGSMRCRYSATINGLSASCGDGWQGELRLRAFDLADVSIDGALRYSSSVWVADAWDVAADRIFTAGAKGYLTNVVQTAPTYWLTMPITSGSQGFASLDAAMTAFTTTSGQRFFLQGMYASFDSVTGSQGHLSFFAEGGLELPLKGQWRRSTLGQEAVVEFTLPTEYLRRTWMATNHRIGWPLYTPAGGSPGVHQYFGEVAGTVFQGVWLNTHALNDLKAARATAL